MDPVPVQARGLTKRYGARTVVDDVSFDLGPGVVTGFVGPNGAGKSTTLRMLLGLDRPDAGSATIGGQPYADHPEPLRVVGAALDARWAHRGRRAVDHLRYLAVSQGIPRRRAEEVLGVVGLADVAGDRVKTFSLGMTQRLAMAVALLGDPPVIVLDEPMNGLDPEGMAWVRRLTSQLAAEGRTVVVSSHLMAELERTAGRLLVLSRGRLVADGTVAEIRGAHADLETAFVAATSGAYASEVSA